MAGECCVALEMLYRAKVFLMGQLHILDGHIVLLIQPSAPFANLNVPERFQIDGRVLCLRQVHHFRFNTQIK